MRIGVDYTAAARQGAGIGRHTRELIAAVLAAQAHAQAPHALVLMAAVAGLGEAWQAQKAQLRALAGPDRLTLRPLPLTDDWTARIWQRLRVPLPANWITGPIDLFYAPDFLLPPLGGGPTTLITIHDLSFLRHPETFTPQLQRYLAAAVPRSVARADHILTDSHATRRDVIELLGVAPDRVTTLHLGVSDRFTPDAAPGEAERLHRTYDLGAAATPYILAVGTVQPRKNYERLIAAVDKVRATVPVELVLAGRAGWLAEPVVEAAAAREHVHLLGFVDDVDLPALYRQAAVLAFPSLYEGFGLPPLEAMACGTPVVASQASSVPEAVGDAGLLIDPLAVDALAVALTAALTDEVLRTELRAQGLARTAQFTWGKMAEGWLEIVESL
jgi:glycosyltransferase involved in cell wall biosynthesis